MKWYQRLRKQAQSARPPSYMVERILDLKNAGSLSTRSPRDSRELLLKIADQFDKQLNPEYAALTRGAAEVVLDSAKRAKDAILSIIDLMEVEREEYEDE